MSYAKTCQKRLLADRKTALGLIGIERLNIFK
jgi:hypothetical protein